MQERSDVEDLTVIEARVLGALMEKQLTTPDVYPLTLKALVTACNQTSNRDPVTTYTPSEVEATLLALKAKGLARVVHPGSGERVTKYRQVADEAFALDAAGRALVCVLLLRGAQTIAELRSRTERLHPFATGAEVEAALDDLAGRSRPLVARVERLPGQKEGRWIQLLEAGAEARARVPSSSSSSSGGAAGGRSAGRVEELEQRMATLEERLAALEDALTGLVELPDRGEPADPEATTGW